MTNLPANITLLGCAGGVARGLLGILDRALRESSDPLHAWIHTAQVHGIDLEIPDDFTAGFSNEFRERLSVSVARTRDADWIETHLRATRSEILVDLTGIDCRAPILACARTGARYLNSAIEITGDMQCEPVRILEEIEIFDEFRKSPDLAKMTGIVGAGMNPGVVQWLAIDLIRRNDNQVPQACYIVEQDTTYFADPRQARPDTAYTTWSPAGFLYEAVHSRPIFMRAHTPVALFKHVYAQEFLVRLGSQKFYGHLMAHEEVLSLGRLYDMETAFLYRINDASCQVLGRSAARDPRSEPACLGLDPRVNNLTGADQVGVLLVYPDREVYAFNSMTTADTFATYGVNATYFQVACGAAAALGSLLFDALPTGLYYVDELLLQTPARYGEYLAAYLKDFTYGENRTSDGLLFDRQRPFPA